MCLHFFFQSAFYINTDYVTFLEREIIEETFVMSKKNRQYVVCIPIHCQNPPSQNSLLHLTNIQYYSLCYSSVRMTCFFF